MNTTLRLIFGGISVVVAGIGLVVNPSNGEPAAGSPVPAVSTSNTSAAVPPAAPPASPTPTTPHLVTPERPADPCAAGWCERRIQAADSTGTFSFNKTEGGWTSPFRLLAGETICAKPMPDLPADTPRRQQLEELLRHKTGPVWLGSSGHASVYFRSPADSQGTPCAPLS